MNETRGISGDRDGICCMINVCSFSLSILRSSGWGIFLNGWLHLFSFMIINLSQLSNMDLPLEVIVNNFEILRSCQGSND